MQLKALFSALLLLPLISATPVDVETPSNRLARRAAFRRRTQPLIKATPTTEYDVKVNDAGNVSHVEYSSNWAGAVYDAPPAGHTFTSVSGQFVVPTPTPPTSSGSGSWSGSAWVGIDGDTYGNAILQTGIDWEVTRSSSGRLSYSYDSWYEWFPDYAYDFSGITISPGNTIALSVVSSSSRAGVATVKNLSTGQTVTKSLTSSAALGGQNAEWIVEDFESGNALVPFAKFGSVTFTNAVAGLSGGTTEGVSGATIIEIESSSGQVLTTVSIPSSNSVRLSY